MVELAQGAIYQLNNHMDHEEEKDRGEDTVEISADSLDGLLEEVYDDADDEAADDELDDEEKTDDDEEGYGNE